MPSMPGMLARCLLNGELMEEVGSAVLESALSAGGVPAFAYVELTDWGVLTDGESAVLR